jgi:hypothetical protein
MTIANIAMATTISSSVKARGFPPQRHQNGMVALFVCRLRWASTKLSRMSSFRLSSDVKRNRNESRNRNRILFLRVFVLNLIRISSLFDKRQYRGIDRLQPAAEPPRRKK